MARRLFAEATKRKQIVVVEAVRAGTSAMFPVLKKIPYVILAGATLVCLSQLLVKTALAQDAISFTSIRYAVPRSRGSAEPDPIEYELDRLGHRGQLITRARSSALAILSAENSCADWYRQSVPDAAEIFRSLHFVVDVGGNGEIVRRAGALGDLEYLQPYVAHARQEEGSGSEIMLNANGAFFKNYAHVRFSTTPPSSYMHQLVRPLVVGDFSGDTPQARTLTMLHEFAHVVGLIPLDSGTPSAAFLSVQNTRTVLNYCKLQIEWEAKQPEQAPRRFLAAAAISAQPRHGVSAPVRGPLPIPPRQ